MIAEKSFTIEPSRWGPHFWRSIDAVAVVFDPLDNQSREFTLLYFHALQGTLPCFECRDHYCLYYREYPVVDALSTKKDLLVWILRLKNRIRERQSKGAAFPLEDYLSYLLDVFGVDLRQS